jgi:hypothetical protein
MAVTENVYQVCNADNASALQPASISYPHTRQGLSEAQEQARERSLSGVPQVVIDPVAASETVIGRFEDGMPVAAGSGAVNAD